jgi:hypothetical protein
MLRRGNAVYFEGLGDLARAYDERLGETALSCWGVEPIRDEKRVFRELGSPSDDRRHQCRMQRLLRTCTRGRGTVSVNRCILWHIHVQPCAEMRWVEEWQTRVHNLEIDLDKVQRKSENGWRERRKCSEELVKERAQIKGEKMEGTHSKRKCSSWNL